MIAYKWVIKKDKKYYPIVNNGAYRPFDDIDLGYYKKGNTVKNYIDPNKLINYKVNHNYNSFHRAGYHFWTKDNEKIRNKYNVIMKRRKNKIINCILKCYIRKKDIIMADSNRVITKKFRILEEINI